MHLYITERKERVFSAKKNPIKTVSSLWHSNVYTGVFFFLDFIFLDLIEGNNVMGWITKFFCIRKALPNKWFEHLKAVELMAKTLPPPQWRDIRWYIRCFERRVHDTDADLADCYWLFLFRVTLELIAYCCSQDPVCVCVSVWSCVCLSP